MRTPSLARTLVACLAAAILGGCGHNPFEVATSALKAGEARWKLHRPQNHSFTVQRNCFCGNTNTLRVEVHGDTPVSITSVIPGQTADTTGYTGYLTIDQIFATLHAIVADKPVQFDGAYEATYGYPIRVDIDRVLNAADDELIVLVGSFLPGTTQ